jgi:hypothetical protein
LPDDCLGHHRGHSTAQSSAGIDRDTTE